MARTKSTARKSTEKTPASAPAPAPADSTSTSAERPIDCVFYLIFSCEFLVWRRQRQWRLWRRQRQWRLWRRQRQRQMMTVVMTVATTVIPTRWHTRRKAQYFVCGLHVHFCKFVLLHVSSDDSAHKELRRHRKKGGAAAALFQLQEEVKATKDGLLEMEMTLKDYAACGIICTSHSASILARCQAINRHVSRAACLGQQIETHIISDRKKAKKRKLREISQWLCFVWWVF